MSNAHTRLYNALQSLLPFASIVWLLDTLNARTAQHNGSQLHMGDSGMVTPQDIDKQNRITTLCSRCRSNYEHAGYRLTFTGNYIKEECDFCGCAFGYDYKLEDATRDNRNG